MATRPAESLCGPRVAARGLALAALLHAPLACAPDAPAVEAELGSVAPPPPSAAPTPGGELITWRYRLPSPGADGRPVFEAGRPVRFRFDGPVPPNVLFSVHRPDGTVAALNPKWHGPVAILDVPAPAVDLGAADFDLEVRFGPSPVRLFPFRVVPSADPRPAVRAAAAACRRGKLAAGLRGLEALEVKDPRETAHFLLVERARCQQSARHADEALQTWLHAAQAAALAGFPAEQTRRLRAAAYMALQARRFAEARRYLDVTVPVDAAIRNEEGEARTLYYRGLIAGELGDLQGALALLDTAFELWSALGVEEDAQFALDAAIQCLMRAGDLRRAADQLARLAEPASRRPWDLARFYMNQAWYVLELAQRGILPLNPAAVRARLERARSLYQQVGNAEGAAEAELNLAWTAFVLGDRPGARAALHTLESTRGGVPSFGARFARMLGAELDLAEGHFERARATFDAAVKAAREEAGGLDSDDVWRGLFGVGRAERAAGPAHFADADAAFQAALTSVEHLARRTLLRDSRARYFDDRRALFVATVETELAQGAAQTALQTVLRNQGHVLDGLRAASRVERLDAGQRTEWERRAEAYLRARAAWEAGSDGGDVLSGARLSVWRTSREAERTRMAAAFETAYDYLDHVAPEADTPPNVAAIRQRLAPDEALLVFSALGDARLAILLRPGTGAPLTTRPTLAGDGPLALPFAGRLAGFAHLYVLPGDVPEARALVAYMDPDGTPSLAHRTLSLVPHAGLLHAAKTLPAGPPLVVADPASNLPHARSEGERVAGRFPGARLLLGDAATRAAVLAGLADASVFHFGGHGFAPPDRPWEARIQLAGDQYLTLADLLVVESHVGVVILSGCETGAQQALGAHDAVGLPDAFLSAGAYAVLATERVVGDQESEWFVEQFYRADGAHHPAQAFATAVATSQAAGETGWQAFRIFGGR